MPIIEIFEPAGCCATNSVVIDQNALRFNADMDWCKQQGFEVKRHNLQKNPQSFISNPRVKELLDVSGMQSLPLTLVNGVVALTGRLPNREELARWFGVEPAPTSCCTPTART
ncbi:arsenite efflux transporter metallochaperone ArsD [Photorhabdus laumondii]|uniref:Arsenical resistance operon transcriptional repressor ArsD n=1 Tax=Photorhabdus laumondii subsp. clarkei TaxID=2029685 RepID=A0A329VH20_9GAMM|nr:arsenic metallochaperone ArsD family protein [Photorhabdus laumondii]PQQ39648.1 arsenical resistance operon transcriptional repressor ArsD [Photorhabdus luminescens]RAW90357.1 arsenical resistance operon transcriptional repressor ArsD [Photorhabdus laumondii subsp. clarkei]